MVTFYLRERSALPPQHSPPAELDQDLEKTIDQTRNHSIVAFETHFDFEMNRSISAMQGLSNAMRKLENRELGVSLAFEHGMAVMIIMLSPFAPMFAAEMWRGFASAPWHYPQLDSLYDWTKDVWQQKWPRVDDQHPLPILVTLNGEEFARLRMPKPDFERVSADNIESILLKHLVPDERFVAKFGSDVRAFEGVTFVNTWQYHAEANIIMNSIPKKKVKNKSYIDIDIQLS